MPLIIDPDTATELTMQLISAADAWPGIAMTMPHATARADSAAQVGEDEVGVLGGEVGRAHDVDGVAA
ncbi:hypothetical protein SSAG_00401 [Streptomyces sp. Mg1]|nr:hypothetical protein SSAG_00401 [Streptomyces sp. Mg1]